MRRVSRWILWGGVFIACAGVGALIAAHTNPFPPAVGRDPSSPSSSASASANPAVQTWRLGIKSSSIHRLYIGGRCTTRWRGAVTLSLDAGNAVTGSGPVRLIGHRICTFPNAQIQLKTIRLSLQGSRKGDKFALQLKQSLGTPAGARDYGGFTGTVLSTPLRLRARAGTTHLHLHRLDTTGRGKLLSNTTFDLTCLSGC